MDSSGEAGRAALAAGRRTARRDFQDCSRAEACARRESLVVCHALLGGLWLSGVRFERREQSVSTCVRLCTLKTALWQETCCRPRGCSFLREESFIHEATRNDTKEKRGLVGPPRSSRSSHPSSCYFV